MIHYMFFFIFFFFNDTATTEIYTLSLHDALPISTACSTCWCSCSRMRATQWRSEEHTSELQSRENLVCRLLLEKKKTTILRHQTYIQTELYTPIVAAQHID